MVSTKISAVLPIRLTSKRLPKKHLLNVNGFPLLWWFLERQKYWANKRGISLDFIVATTIEKENDELIDFCINNSIKCYQGNIRNIPLRLLQTSISNNSTDLILLDGDDILSSVDGVFIAFQLLSLSHKFVRTFNLPFGMNITGINTDLLCDSLKSIQPDVILETGWGRIFNQEKPTDVMFPSENYYGKLRFTIDYKEDFYFYEKLIESIKENFISYSDIEIIDFVYKKKIYEANSHLNLVYWENFNREVSNETTGL